MAVGLNLLITVSSCFRDDLFVLITCLRSRIHVFYFSGGRDRVSVLAFIFHPRIMTDSEMIISSSN